MKIALPKTALLASILGGVLFGALTTAIAQAPIYEEDWGTTNGGSTVAYALNASSPTYPFISVGWSIVIPASQSGTGPPYEGIYQAAGANDSSTGYSLPVNTVYYTGLANQAGFIYTTSAAGSGTAGDSAFPTINPTLYPGLSLNAEISAEGGTTATNYFALLVGGSWYVSATPMTGSSPGYPAFANVCLPYTTSAGTWNNLSFTANTVTIGSAAGALSGNITGIGIVQVGTGGWNYNEIAIQTNCGGLGVQTPASILAAPVSQSVYAGGGVSFAVAASGNTPLTYTWDTNGVALVNGGRIFGATTPLLTITNVNANDAANAYSVVVANDHGVNSATNSSFTLTVNTVPADVLYAETVPYIGPTGAGNLPLSTIGWVLAAPNGGIYDNGGGAGAVYNYTGLADTIIHYADTTTDTNQSGLAFPTINPASYPFIAFETALSLGNGAGATDVTAYFAVEMKNASGSVSNWYVYYTNIPFNASANGFNPYELQFTTDGTKWNNLTFTTTNATIGSPASGTLTNNITGAGLVFTLKGGGGDFNWNLFEITTDQVVATAPVIGLSGVPWSQTVYSGGGVSYQVSTQSGTQPFSYYWKLNGVELSDGALADGAIVSGSKTPTLTIAAITDAEVGGTSGGTVDVAAFVQNFQGTDESDSGSYYGAAGSTLTVNNPTIGTIYTEAFPFINPSGAGNYPVSQDGWTEAYYQSPNSLYDITGLSGVGAVFVYDGTPATVAYYATTTTDTNQSGLPFPNIDPAGFPGSLTLSVNLEAGNSAGNVTAYWAVAMTSRGVTNWYVSANAIAAPGASFAPATLAFDPAAANWNNLTITPSGAAVGSPAASPLSGVMTGAGLVFVVVGSGGDYNFDNFQISGTGVGNIVLGTPTATTVPLYWVGNPAVQLQSATSLANGGNWANVSPSTLGKYSTTVSTVGGPKYYRLHGTE